VNRGIAKSSFHPSNQPSVIQTTTTHIIEMSNTQVGAVYQQIIADVVESSRVDFEEGGVDEHVLEELKLVWMSLSPFVALVLPFFFI